MSQMSQGSGLGRVASAVLAAPPRVMPPFGLVNPVTLVDEDDSRWEIKGSRSREFKLTINQSHIGIDETTFLVYCGFPEEDELHGIYCLEGSDRYFTPRQEGRNMRQFLLEYIEEVDRLYP